MWTLLTTGPYLDLLTGMWGPFKAREDGTALFVSALGPQGRIPFMSLDDIAWWARYIFDNPTKTTGKDLEVASEVISYPELVERFTRATGIPAELKEISFDEYFEMLHGADQPIAQDLQGGTSIEEDFRSFFALYRDNVVKRDMDWVRSVHPGTMTLERWIKENNYTGGGFSPLLKAVEDNKFTISRVDEKVAAL